MSLTFGANTTDRVDCGSGAAIDDIPSGANGFTVLAIIKRTSDGANQQIATKDLSTVAGRWSFLIDNSPSEGVARLVVGRPGGTNTNYITSTVVSALDTWKFVAGAFKDGGAPDVSIYYSALGEAVAEASYNTTTNGSGTLGTDAAAKLFIGNLERSTTLPFKGPIGVVALVDRRMTLAECEDWKNNPRMIEGCVAFYELGNNGTGTQPDLSGNGNAGTVTGATQSDNPPLARSRRRVLMVPYAVAAPAGSTGPLIGAGRLIHGGILTRGRLAA